MLADIDAIATIAVKDLNAARRFYGGTLGLREQPGADDSAVITYQSGTSRVLVYASPYAGTNKATSATWNVGGELESIVRTLAGQGVAFEHYDLPGLTLQGDIHRGGGVSVAWFKDPDGNILSIVSVAE
jgi:catechol 2,3-dioxygenase-like lactoylglutathione lyase family enzyme